LLVVADLAQAPMQAVEVLHPGVEHHERRSEIRRDLRHDFRRSSCGGGC
jgi:hypothetical protein